MPDQRIQVPPNCELTLGMTCLDKSQPGEPSGRCGRTNASPTRPASSRGDHRRHVRLGDGRLLGHLRGGLGPESLLLQRGDEDSFLAAARWCGVQCTAEVISGGKRIAFAEAEVTDDAGKVVARAKFDLPVHPKG